MRDVRCVCKACGQAFLWTHEERIAATQAFEPDEAMQDTRSFKIETDRMRKPEFCSGCREKNAR